MDKASVVHELKTWPSSFQDILDNVKTFELRKDDRGYKAGDILWLREYSPVTHYTGRETYRLVTYIFREFPGLEKGYVIMGIKDIAGEREFVYNVAKAVRGWMTSHYGEGVNLAGHCIEASELICDILQTAKIKADTVEGWVRYDDFRYAEYPYEAHTWVEVTLNKVVYYLDVTADQFNYGMDPEYKFAGIIFQEGYPHGVRTSLEEEGIMS